MKTYYYATIEKNGKTRATRNYKTLDKLLRKLEKATRNGYEVVDTYEIMQGFRYYSCTTLCTL